MTFMIIQNSALAFQSRHDRLVHTQSSERLEMWSGRRPAAPPARALNPTPPAESPRHADEPEALAGTGETRAADRRSLPPALQTLARMIEALTGRPIRLLDGETLEPAGASPREAASGGAAGAAAPAEAPQGWGLVYEATQTRIETERLRVEAAGEIRTADGRSVSFRMAIQMESVQIDTRQTSLRAGDAVLKDPLVLHFDGPVGELRDTRFAFDLDADGQTDRMPFVGRGSGFLALDRNQNATVDNGSELFGALTGDGFAELAAYDKDRNGWIDEADAVFQQLRVWRMDDAGDTRLVSLADSGVGALSLGRVDSSLRLQEGAAGGQTLGQLRQTGLYLTEQGSTKALQQIDLVV